MSSSKEFFFNAYYPQNRHLFFRINPGSHLPTDDQQGNLHRERADTITAIPGTSDWNPRNMPPPPTIPTRVVPAAVASAAMRNHGWGASAQDINDRGEGGSDLSNAYWAGV